MDDLAQPELRAASWTLHCSRVVPLPAGAGGLAGGGLKGVEGTGEGGGTAWEGLPPLVWIFRVASTSPVPARTRRNRQRAGAKSEPPVDREAPVEKVCHAACV